MCIMPSSMDSMNIVIENFDLGKNYFEKKDDYTRETKRMKRKKQS